MAVNPLIGTKGLGTDKHKSEDHYQETLKQIKSSLSWIGARPDPYPSSSGTLVETKCLPGGEMFEPYPPQKRKKKRMTRLILSLQV